MKFGKELVSQMVPEWQEAYMNYNTLKTILKELSWFKERNQSAAAMATTPKGSLKRRLTLYRAFSGLTGRQRGSPKMNEDEVILVRAEEGEEELYQTMFLKPSEDGAERHLVFFKKLDSEFNKVNAFYKKMVKEVVDEAEELSKQMNALIALRIKVDKVGFNNLASNEMLLTSTSIKQHRDDAKHGKIVIIFLFKHIVLFVCFVGIAFLCS